MARIGGRNVSILLQDYEQVLLVPLPGTELKVGGPEPIEDSPAGEAFLGRERVEVPQGGSVRMYLPLLDGSDQIGRDGRHPGQPSTTTTGGCCADSPAWSPT